MRGFRAISAVGITALLFVGCEDDPSPATTQPDAQGQRPLQLPVLSADEAAAIETPGGCLTGERAVGAIGVPGIRKEAALGPGSSEQELERGPAYVALAAGPPRIVLLSSAERVAGSRWRWAIKTIVISRPPYEGPVLVRGARLDGARGRLRFGGGSNPRMAFELPAGAWDPRGVPLAGGGLREGWRAEVVVVRLRGAGCYAFQLDGADFSYALPFAVQAG